MRTVSSVDHLFYFGRFNVAHTGYILVIKTALQALHPTHGITALPSSDHPTWNKDVLPFLHRVEMLKTAIASECDEQEQQQIHVSTLEQELFNQGLCDGYTITALKELRSQHPANETFGILMGAGSFLSFHKWEQFEEILHFAHLYVIPRSSLDTEAAILAHVSPTLLPYLEGNTAQITILPLQEFSEATYASSSKVLAGAYHFLPPSVFSYASSAVLL